MVQKKISKLTLFFVDKVKTETLILKTNKLNLPNELVFT